MSGSSLAQRVNNIKFTFIYVFPELPLEVIINKCIILYAVIGNLPLVTVSIVAAAGSCQMSL